MRLKERGDTIIEVLFAVTVFAMVAVGSMTIMNQGTAAAQRALEISLVRQQIDAQAEAIRYIHQAYVSTYQREGVPPSGTAAEWRKMTVDRAAAGASNFAELENGRCPASVPGDNPFILNARMATVSSAVPQMTPPTDGSMPPFAQVDYNNDSSIRQAYGIWIESIPSTTPNGQPGFVDFHIRACWDSPGSSTPMTLGTIVRLYEPR